MSKKGQYVTIILFAIVLYGLSALHWILPDQKISETERRKKEQFPTLSVETVYNGTFTTLLESYLQDQFPFREEFRTAKAVTRFQLFFQMDQHNIYIADGSAVKIENTLDTKQVQLAMKKIQYVYEHYLANTNVYYSIIPDKHYFAGKKNGYPSMDYQQMVKLVGDNLDEEMEYIDIFCCLSLSDYYRTDSHWRQDRLKLVRNRIAGMMLGEEWDTLLPDWNSYEKKTYSPFYGVYYGQSALPMGSDVITYLNSEGTNTSVVTSIEKAGEMSVYEENLSEKIDKYDLFLHGAQAVLTIQNPNASTDRELVIFRDSYGSSLAPLFADTYAKITLVDLRYIPSNLVGDYVQISEGSDVLFLYSTTVLNSGAILR